MKLVYFIFVLYNFVELRLIYIQLVYNIVDTNSNFKNEIEVIFTLTRDT